MARVTVRVYHASYGCQTGCCGHYIELTLPDGETREEWSFDHPWNASETTEEWARQEALEVINHRWPECAESIDWDSFECEATNNC